MNEDSLKTLRMLRESEEEQIKEIANNMGVTVDELHSSSSIVIEAVASCLISYDEAICLGLLDEEQVVDLIGIENAIEENILTEEEAERWELESNSLIEVVNVE